MMTRHGRRRHDCCPGHDPKSYHHGTERAREKREWMREGAQDTTACSAPEGPTNYTVAAQP